MDVDHPLWPKCKTFNKSKETIKKEMIGEYWISMHVGWPNIRYSDPGSGAQNLEHVLQRHFNSEFKTAFKTEMLFIDKLPRLTNYVY